MNLSSMLLQVLGEGARVFWQLDDDNCPPSFVGTFKERQDILALAATVRLQRLATLGMHSFFPQYINDDDVRKAFKQAEMHSMMLDQDRSFFTQKANELGLEFAFMKGALADAAFWRRSGLRGGSDIDVLLKKSDLAAVHSFLLEDGFRLREDEKSPATWDAKPERHFQHVEHRFDFDVHYEFGKTSLYARCGAQVLARATRYGDEKIPGLNESDWLATLALNMASQKFEGMYTAALDAYAISVFAPEQVEKGVRRAREWGADWGLWGLYRLVTLGFGAPWPGGPPETGLNAAKKRIVDEVLGLNGGKRAQKKAWQRLFFVERPLLGTRRVARDVQKQAFLKSQDYWSRIRRLK